MATEPAATENTIGTRATALRMYACLFFLLLLLFSWMISDDCYFNARTCQVMAWSFPVLLFFWLVVYERSFRRRGYMLPVRGKLQKPGPVAIRFHIAMMAGLCAFMTWLCLYALLCLAIFTTSRIDSRTTVMIEVAHASGRCATSYSFFDPSLDRRVHNCGLPYRQAASGDSADVARSVGPFGMRLRSVRPVDGVHTRGPAG